MVRLRPAPLLAVLAAGVLLSACGGASSPGAPPAPSGEASTSDDVASAEPVNPGLVVRVERTGGFTTPVELASRLPVVSVHADGRAVEPGPQALIYPPPALPNLLVRQVDPSRLPELVALAVDAGVGGGPPPDLGQPPIADATTTRFTVVTDTGRHELDAYALVEASIGPGQPGPGEISPPQPDLGLTEAQEAARARLLGLMASLQDLTATLGADAVSDVAPYEADAVAALTSPYDPQNSPEAARPAVGWPGPALPGEPIGGVTEAGCVTATGTQADAVLEAASPATAITPWVSGEQEWTVALRPLMPDEQVCGDLTGHI